VEQPPPRHQQEEVHLVAVVLVLQEVPLGVVGVGLVEEDKWGALGRNQVLVLQLLPLLLPLEGSVKVRHHNQEEDLQDLAKIQPLLQHQQHLLVISWVGLERGVMGEEEEQEEEESVLP